MLRHRPPPEIRLQLARANSVIFYCGGLCYDLLCLWHGSPDPCISMSGKTKRRRGTLLSIQYVYMHSLIRYGACSSKAQTHATSFISFCFVFQTDTNKSITLNLQPQLYRLVGSYFVSPVMRTFGVDSCRGTMVTCVWICSLCISCFTLSFSFKVLSWRWRSPFSSPTQ